MTPRELILRHEGESLKLYKDSEGYYTIGVGRLLDPALGGGISHQESMFLLDNDIAKAQEECESAYPWFVSLSDARKAAMLDLMFNMGQKRLNGFVKFLSAMSQSNWETAAQELRNSKWFNQVGIRSREIVNLIQHEEWPS